MTALDNPIVRVVVAEDRAPVRSGLDSALGHLPGVAVVGTATHHAQVPPLLDRHRPEVLLLGLALPGGDPVELTRTVRAEHPATAVIVIPVPPVTNEQVLPVLQAGAAGWLPPMADRDRVIQALRAVAAGGGGTPRRPAGRDHRGELTAREADVLGLVAAGLTNAEIARRLSVSEATVKTHLNHAYTKVGLQNRAEAVEYAKRQGLGPAEPA
ncbi:response regulator transcription factor [Kutzneria sp. CA-103260]|uniref:response regulator transcription factor n=1 Tax=Kutzneria sp. CA-103260 TaxID=2802641 RepID=UPI001BA7D5E4|nr:response regulator transcription factor [Kutzneria sp. CA-103260]QUQ67415.1 response regulator transcription factor [Kutzneria sp. CA-103260]